MKIEKLFTISAVDKIICSHKSFACDRVICLEKNCQCSWCAQNDWRLFRSTISSNSSYIGFIEDNIIENLHIIISTFWICFQIKWIEFQLNQKTRRCNNEPFTIGTILIATIWWWWWNSNIWSGYSSTTFYRDIDSFISFRMWNLWISTIWTYLHQ